MLHCSVLLDAHSHPVIRLILDRKQGRSRPGMRGDPHKLGLVLEGGGMRGVVSAAMGLALEHLGLRDVFDVVYGSSAGTVNGAYFVAGQMAYGVSIYYQNINSSRFISFRRLFRGAPIVSLDYLFSHVMRIDKPLDAPAVLESDVPLKVLASSLKRRRAVVFDRFASFDDLLLKLKAGALMPWAAGPPVSIDGELFVDASLYDSVPYGAAVAGGCTHVLALLSRPADCIRPDASLARRLFMARYFRRYNADAYADYVQRPSRYRTEVERAVEATATGKGPPYLYAMQPPAGSRAIDSMERGHARLVAAAAEGLRVAYSVIMGRDPQVVEILKPFDLSRPIECRREVSN